MAGVGAGGCRSGGGSGVKPTKVIIVSSSHLSSGQWKLLPVASQALLTGLPLFIEYVLIFRMTRGCRIMACLFDITSPGSCSWRTVL